MFSIVQMQCQGAVKSFQVIEEVEEVIQREKPTFITQLQPAEGLQEGEPIHLEATFEPARDPDMKVCNPLDHQLTKMSNYMSFQVVWRKNGQPLMASQLIQTHHELGWATLDIPTANEDHNGMVPFGLLSIIDRFSNRFNPTSRHLHPYDLEQRGRSGVDGPGEGHQSGSSPRRHPARGVVASHPDP